MRPHCYSSQIHTSREWRLLFLSFAVLITAVLPLASGLVTFETSNISSRTFHAPEWRCTGTVPPVVSGRLLCLHTLHRMMNYSISELQTNYTGSILFMSTSNVLDGDFPPFFFKGQSRETRLVEVATELKLAGIFLYNTAARVGSTAEVLLFDHSWCPKIGAMSIPIYETGLTSGQELIQLCELYANSTEIRVNMTTGDPNEWMDAKRGWYLIVFRIVMSLAGAAAASLALAKLIAYYKAEGLRANIPQLTLALQFIASLFRTIICALDPIYAGMIFNATQAHMVSTISFPVNYITTLLLAMYWSELLDQSKIHITSFLTRLKIPFIIASIVITVVEVVTSVVRAERFGRVSVASTLSAVVYIIFSLAICGFFFIFGYRVITRMRESAKASNISGQASRQEASLRRVTGLLVGSGIFNVLFIAAFVIAAAESFFYTPRGFHLSWTLMYVGQLGGSLTQVLAVKFPSVSTSSSTKSASGALSPRSSNGLDTNTPASEQFSSSGSENL